MTAGRLTISVREASLMTGICEPTIRAAINRRALPAVKNGRAILIRVTDLDEWIGSLPKAST